MKKCIKCNEEKELTNFYKDKRNLDGFINSCKICIKECNLKYKEKSILWRINNSEKRKEYEINYRNIHKEKRKQYFIDNSENLKDYQYNYRINNIEKIKQWRINNSEKIKEYQNNYIKNKRLNNPVFKLKFNIRNLIRISIKKQGYSKKSKTFEILGCSFEEFKDYLEKQFTEGMTWNNAGEWHLDHIYPISLAKDEQEVIRLNHYTNFQPLWAIDNIKKGNKII